MGEKWNQRKRNVKIKATEKERNIKTYILREQQAESAKMRRKRTKTKKSEALQKRTRR